MGCDGVWNLERVRASRPSVRTSPFLLGIDVRGATRPGRIRPTGVGHYTRQLVRAMAVLQTKMVTFQHPAAPPLCRGVDTVVSNFSNDDIAWLSVVLPYLCRKRSIDVLLIPEQNAPVFKTCPTVVVFHDLAFERHPDLYQGAWVIKMKAATRWAARAADHLIAVSHTTKADLVQLYGVAAERVTVVHHGCDPAVFRPRTAEESHSELSGLAIDGPYLLFVGALHRRKNIGMLVKALAHLPALQLILAGPDQGESARLQGLARQLGVDRRVRFLGYVSESQKAHLMSSASSVALPSFYEGFGLPAVEAMASGAPVIGASTGALPEIIGSAGLTVDPNNLDGWVAAIRRTTSIEERSRFVRLGRRRAKVFTWDYAARQVLTIAERFARV